MPPVTEQQTMQRDGWAQPDRQATWHYFQEQTSLCRKWEYAGIVAEDPWLHGLICYPCARQAPLG
jgi:hypothetical protein